MLSYQHMYHAGCLADVQKHAALTLILGKMAEKDKPLTYMETHAGRGLYDLTSPEANKTKEAAAGILALAQQSRIPAKHPYLQLLETVKARFGANAYPGSPLIAQTLLRAEDRLHLMELHPREYEALARQMRGRNIRTYLKDGYTQVLTLAPPPNRRGLVLIDPSYEVKDEYRMAADFIRNLHRKWPEATILLWYPILTKGHHIAMLEMLEQAALPNLWQQQILFRQSEQRALGTGLWAANMPDGMEAKLAEISGWLSP